THLGSVWSWGWATFGAASADPDKPAAACVYLWARDQSLCDGPATAGPSFNTSLVEGQIILPPRALCGLHGGRRIAAADVTRLAAFTHDRHAAIDALFTRLVFRSTVPVTNAQVLAVENGTVARDFGGNRAAYVGAVTQAGATLGMARDAIRDE